MPFDLHSKNVYLTYPRCDIPKEEAIQQISTAVRDKPLSFIAVSHEHHIDGGDHLHALLCFDRKFRTRNERFFDLLGPRGQRFHCNIQGARNVADVYQYVTKDGDFLEDGTKPRQLQPPGSVLSKRDAAFAALDADNDTVDDFMSALRQHHPYEFFTRGNTIRANVESVKRKRWDYEAPHSEFHIPGNIQDWLDTEFDQEVCYPLNNRHPPGADQSFVLVAARPLHAALP